jgi:hypothetical protein
MRQSHSSNSRIRSSRGKRRPEELRRMLLGRVCCGQIQAGWSMMIGKS